jgi:hypothetical protein
MGGKMKKNLIVTCLLILTYTILPVGDPRDLPLPEIIKPDILAVRGDDLLIAQGAEISVYSLKSGRVTATFGKKGSGPREFILLPTGTGLRVNIYPDFIFVGSIGKISWFDRKGEFIREQKINPFGRMTPFGEGFAGIRIIFTPGQPAASMMGFYLFDREGEQTKEIARYPSVLLQGPDITLLDLLAAVTPHYRTSGDRIYIAGKQTFQVDIFNGEGNLLHTITHRISPRPLTDQEKRDLQEAYRVHPVYKAFWNRIEKSVRIPDYFPEYREITLSEKRLYVLTHNRKGEKTVILVFDTDGNFLKEVFVPVAFQNLMIPYLYTIDDATFFQLVDDEDDEWRLKIIPLDL